MHRRRTAVLLTAVLALGGVAAGCGSDENASPVERIRASSEKTIDAGSSKMFISVETEGATDVVFEGEGAFDYKERTGTMKMDTSQFAAAGFPKELELVMDGQVIYMNLGGILPGGKPWAKLDLNDADELGEQFKALSQLGANNDPRSTLAYVQGVSDDVKTVGKESVRDVSTTHYKATIDLDVAEANAESEDAKKAVRALIDQLGTTTMPAEFWIDSDGLLRRYRSSIDLSKIKGAKEQSITGTSTTTMELFDFGTDVKIETPPADETTDFADLLKAAGAS